jgi:hypothetical protein
MLGKIKKAFFAYPGSPGDLTGPITSAADLIQTGAAPLELTTWAQLEIFGVHIPDEVRSSIRESEAVICDVTRPNMNVYYEVGFAIGSGKTIAPVVNVAFEGAVADLQRDGIFDNIGYAPYENSLELSRVISNITPTNMADLYGKGINYQQPLFLLDSYRKTDFRNAIVSAVKASKVFYRSFDPVEVPRFSTVAMIAEVTASSGLIIPFLAPHIDDANRHNLRAAFLAGLGHGLGRQTLLLRMSLEDNTSPADYRDMVKSVRGEDEIAEVVGEFARAAHLASQSMTALPANSKKKSALQRLSIGASAAENEFRTLEEYFVETAEYLRTLRGEINVVAGRKGSGKTAIFFRVRDNFRKQRDSFVTDLKPESHQLSLFREELLRIVDAGVFDHTLSAFWYFVILSEILYTIKKELERKSKYDSRALAVVREISEVLAQSGVADSGDFTSRINRLGSVIIQEIDRAGAVGEKLSPERLTNIVFRGGIARIRDLIQKHTTGRTQLILLFDNIDKGWPTNGVHPFDVRLVRLLIEALDKARRDFAVAERDLMSVVFLRNDIYELLVEHTPDRGKAGQVRIDWTDRAKLRQVIYRRIQTSMKDQDSSFEAVWHKIFVPTVQSKDSFEYLVDHCLMRPRFLINIIENSIANAINRGHQQVQEEDCVDAVRQHSLYLVEDFGYEIRDVSGLSADLLYSLVGVTQFLTKEEVYNCLELVSVAEPERDKAFHLLMWYGVLGIVARDGRERFIYDYEYNIRRLEAELRALDGEVLFVVNAALHVALSG